MPLTNKRKKYLRKGYKRHKVYGQEYYQKHKAEIYEKTKDKMKQYYIEHRDVILARAKKGNKDNPRKAAKHSMDGYYKQKMKSKLLSVKTEGKENSQTIDK